MDKKELFKLAKQDVYHAIALHVGMCNGMIEIADDEEFMESFYYLKLWKKKLGNKAPHPLEKAIKMFEDFIKRTGLLDQRHLDFWFEEKAKTMGDFQNSWATSTTLETTSSAKPTPEPEEEEKAQDFIPLLLFFPPGGLPS